MIFLGTLFGFVAVILAYALMGDKGKHTKHARRKPLGHQITSVKPLISKAEFES